MTDPVFIRRKLLTGIQILLALNATPLVAATPGSLECPSQTLKPFKVDDFFNDLEGQLSDDSAATDANSITDSLVRNLSCEKLTRDNVLTFGREDAFNISRHIPLQNWVGTIVPGNCWALARAQRKLFYMTRFNVKEAPAVATPKTIQNTLDLLSSQKLAPDASHVIQIRDRGLSRIIIKNRISIKPDWFFAQTMAGPFGSLRNVRDELEESQEDRFFSTSNLELLTGNRERDVKSNRETLTKILSDLKKGRMPLLVLRASATTQHVVLIKKLAFSAGNDASFIVYDSNSPFLERKLYYKNGQFYAPNIFRSFEDVDDWESPVGAFLTDEEEMDAIQEANYQYYAEACRKKARKPSSHNSNR
jgi:hypothetical protein